MFRSRFADAFPPKCPHVGPQDIERGVAEDIPSPLVESLLCALLGLVLNRKKPVELVAPPACNKENLGRVDPPNTMDQRSG
jgi:hypothetical protein